MLAKNPQPATHWHVLWARLVEIDLFKNFQKFTIARQAALHFNFQQAQMWNITQNQK